MREIENELKKITKALKIGVSLTKYTTFKIGGPAKYFVEVENEKQLKEIYELCFSKNIKHFLIGAGSNLLIKDEGFDGVIVKLTGEFKTIMHSDTKLTVGGGALLSVVQAYAVKNSLSGLEQISGIPGTVGGAVTINAGTKFGCISDNLESVKVFDSKNTKFIILQKSEIEFSYRYSSIKNSVITEATFDMKIKRPEDILKKINENMVWRMKTQPFAPSAGSIFKNPSGKFAGKLIEECGLKGTKIGGAMISREHANFIINTGNATARDVIELIDLCRKKVLERFGVDLELEIEII